MQWLDEGFMEQTNNDWQLWYYFNSIWDHNYRPGGSQRTVPGINWQEEMDHADCIVLMYTAHNLPELGNGFIEKAYDRFFPQH